MRDHLVNEGGLLAARAGLQSEHLERAPGDEGGHHQAQRRDHHHRRRDDGIDREHEKQGAHDGLAAACWAHDGQNACEQLRKAHQQAVRELVHIRDDAADNIARGLLVQIGQGQALDMSEGVSADVAHGAVGQAVIAQAHQPLGQSRQGHQRQNAGQDGPQRREIDRAGPQQQIHRIAGENGHIQRAGHGDHAQHKRGPKVTAVPSNIG